MDMISINGLVIREYELNEYDKILTLLTPEKGRISVCGMGVRSMKNKNSASSQLFTYSNFTINKKGKYYHMYETELYENFYSIREDITKFALASYICDMINDIAVEESDESELLRLTLNTLYAIAKDIRPLELIRGAYEMRTAAVSGFMPDLVACSVCGEYLPHKMYLDIMNGALICDKCRKSLEETSDDMTFQDRTELRPVAQIDDTVLSALRYVIYSDEKKFLSFTLEKKELKVFSEVCERYLLNHLERGFDSLDFYKTLREEE